MPRHAYPRWVRTVTLGQHLIEQRTAPYVMGDGKRRVDEKPAGHDHTDDAVGKTYVAEGWPKDRAKNSRRFMRPCIRLPALRAMDGSTSARQHWPPGETLPTARWQQPPDFSQGTGVHEGA